MIQNDRFKPKTNNVQFACVKHGYITIPNVIPGEVIGCYYIDCDRWKECCAVLRMVHSNLIGEKKND